MVSFHVAEIYDLVGLSIKSSYTFISSEWRRQPWLQTFGWHGLVDLVLKADVDGDDKDEIGEPRAEESQYQMQIPWFSLMVVSYTDPILILNYTCQNTISSTTSWASCWKREPWKKTDLHCSLLYPNKIDKVNELIILLKL